jgi:hypothetical protein
MKLILEYTNAYIRQLSRNFSALFFTLFFPAMLLQFSDGHAGSDATLQLFTFIIYCNFAVQTVAFQKLGISISAERGSAWQTYLKTLPTTSFYMNAGRVLSSLFFAFISLMLVLLVNHFNHRLNLSTSQQGLLVFSALLGGIPMALLAIFLGNILNASAGRGAFVMLNILLLFGAFSFSTNVRIKSFIPTYEWMMLSNSLVSHQSIMTPVLWLTGYSVVFYMLIKLTERISIIK